MEVASVAYLVGLILAVTHYFGETIDEYHYRYRPAVASAAAGITSAYIFLQLLPETLAGTTFFGNYAFLIIFIGFSILHIAEKYIYHHEKDLEELRYDFKELHSIFLFVYHTAIGIIITLLMEQSIPKGLLFFIPIFIHTAVNSLSLKELHEDILDNRFVKLLVSASVLLGITIAIGFNITQAQFHAIIGLITGMFLYIVVRDTLRPSSRGEPWSFLSGAAIYSTIIIYIWQFI